MFAACKVFEVNTADTAKGNLKELEEYEREYIEQSKIVVKFECRELGGKV